MKRLEVKNLHKKFDNIEVLKGVSFELNQGDVISIIGSSGSGKTTLLRCLNFLELPDKGEIAIDDRTLFDGLIDTKLTYNELAQRRKPFGLVFQNFNLFPHYNVMQNITIAPTLDLPRKIREYKSQLFEEIKPTNANEIKKLSEKKKKTLKILKDYIFEKLNKKSDEIAEEKNILKTKVQDLRDKSKLLKVIAKKTIKDTPEKKDEIQNKLNQDLESNKKMIQFYKEQSNTKIESLTLELKKIKNDIVSENVSEEKKKKIAEYKKEIEGYKERIQSLKNEESKYQKKISTLKSEIKELKEKKTDKDIEAINQKKQEIESIKKEEKCRIEELNKQVKKMAEEYKKEIESKTEAILKRVGLFERSKAYPCELSGGQQQRVAIARALAMSPEILCFDEPTSALDPELTCEVLNVIKDLKKDKITMIVVTHEMEFARSVSDKVIFMADGIIEEVGTPEEIFGNPKSEKLKQFLNKSLEL